MAFHDIFRHLPKGYSTHNALLLKVLEVSEGDVLELGGGAFSTPLLHWYCKNKNRRLITYDDDENYYGFEHQFQSKLHSIKLVTSWDEVDAVKHRGLVFIDHGGKKSHDSWRGSRRGIDVIRFKDSADYIVMHDTEPKFYKDYGYDAIWEQFKYRFDWKECRPWTSVVSNHKELSWLN
jgi:hypothetical protein